jgi:hypothetical protein
MKRIPEHVAPGTPGRLAGRDTSCRGCGPLLGPAEARRAVEELIESTPTDNALLRRGCRLFGHATTEPVYRESVQFGLLTSWSIPYDVARNGVYAARAIVKTPAGVKHEIRTEDFVTRWILNSGRGRE